MLRNKWVLIGVLGLLVLVLAFVFVPWLTEDEEKAPPRAAERRVPAESARDMGRDTGPEDFGAPAERAPEGAALTAPDAAPVSGDSRDAWAAAFAGAERDTSRSPFQRKYEGLGKVFIRSRPSGAEIFVNGILMPKLTDWLVPVSFPAGRYLLELRKEGYEPYVTDLIVPEGLEDFEEITTINAALHKKPIAGVQAAHRNMLYVEGQPPVRVSMIMHGTEQSWAVVQLWPPCMGCKKWVVTEGDEIEFSTGGQDKKDEKEVFEKMKIIKILPDMVTIRNLLINLDYDFPVGEAWSASEGNPYSGSSS